MTDPGGPSDTRWFAFLRAINTGGRRLTNDEQVVPFAALGFTDVAAHQAAGNITFRAAGEVDLDEVERTVEDAYGFPSEVFLRSGDEVDDVVAADVFTDDELAGTAGRVQVTFLHAAPDDATRAEVEALVPDEDVVRFTGRHWWWLPVAGVSGSSLPVRRVEAVVGPMTMRTLGTVTRMRRRFPD